MLGAKQFRLLVRLSALAVLGILILSIAAPSLAAAHSAGVAAGRSGHAACGSREHPIEVTLPFELQANLFHSLPIAGLLVTPDAIAERVLTNPRLRVTTESPLTGMGGSHPVNRSGVVDTHADPPN